MLTQIGDAEALDELAELDESVQEGMHALIGKAQAGSPLVADGNRPIDGLEPRCVGSVRAT